eukprot:gene3519-4022_t
MKLPVMPKIQDLIRMYGLSAKQQLSQNFLLDLNVTDKICKLAGGFQDCTVIEVGAGPGGLTRSLLTSGAKKVIAVEMDKRFIPALRMLEEASEGRLSVVMGDMMEVDEQKILEQFGAERVDWTDKSKVKIIGNLPFNVGTHLMLKWVRQIKPREGLFHFGRVPMILMFQKELADGQQNTVPGKVFVPPPKVDASVVYIEPMVKAVGNHIDPKKRPQNLTIQEMVDIANRFTAWPGKKEIDMLPFRNNGKTLRHEEKQKKRGERLQERLEQTKEKIAKFKALEKKEKTAYLRDMEDTISKGFAFRNQKQMAIDLIRQDNEAMEQADKADDQEEDGIEFDEEFDEEEDAIDFDEEIKKIEREIDDIDHDDDDVVDNRK